MLLLAIETSSARGSLALLEDGAVIARSLFPEGLVHGREIIARLDEMMASRGLAPDRLEAIAVGLGPGSYTGIRVGVTAAKSLAFALRIPVVAESSLRAIAGNARASAPASGPLLVVPAVDGKQRQVYIARFRLERRSDGSVAVIREMDDAVIELTAVLEGDTRAPAGPGALVLGDAADALLAAAPSAGAVRGPREADRPMADVLGGLAAEAIAAERPRFEEDAIHALAPIYLRPSEAERRYGAARPPARGAGPR